MTASIPAGRFPRIKMYLLALRVVVIAAAHGKRYVITRTARGYRVGPAS